MMMGFLTLSETAIAASAIFKVVDAEAHNDPMNTGAFYGKNGVAWVLRFGGLCTLVCCYPVHLPSIYRRSFWQVGAVLCRMVPPTHTEKEMRRRLGEMRVLEQEQTP
jgi:solute carrier family 45 protein 1/2/4